MHTINLDDLTEQQLVELFSAVLHRLVWSEQRMLERWQAERAQRDTFDPMMLAPAQGRNTCST